MAVDVEELIISPFREVVERGKEAVTNAEEAQDEYPDQAKQMMKSAQIVSKEGERALKRLQPLWDSQVEKHGDVFKEMIGDNDELAEKRRVLEELLYDFEDFMEVDTFDSSKFTEVQVAAKSFALDVLDFIKRMKIEAKTPVSPVHTFPPLPPLPPLPAQSPKLNSKSGPVPTSRGGQGGANLSLFPAAGRQPKPQVHRSGTRSSQGSSDGMTIRRPSIAQSVGSDPRSSRAYSSRSGHELAKAEALSASTEEQRSSSPDGLGDEGGRLRVMTTQDALQPRTSDWVEEQAPLQKPRRPLRGSIPENSVVANHATIDNTTIARFNQLGLERNATPQSSVFDPTSPSTTYRTSVYSDSPTHSSIGPSPDLQFNELRTSSLAAIQFEPAVPINLPNPSQYSDGLMLANEQTASPTSGQNPRSVSTLTRDEECSIGPKSSFHQHKGFCDGAQAFRRGGYWDGLKRTMAYVSTAMPQQWSLGESRPIGRCLNCEYYHIYNELALDNDGDSRANFLKFGVLYRMRFLIKSHIPALTTSEIRYACLFCTHAGHTVHEGDATVFVTADQLLKHISRHPQPLPELPGVTVLYGQVEKDHPQIESYDVHFPSPPAPSPFPDFDTLVQFPVATALKSHMERWGETLMGPDGSEDVLKFFAGSKIVGVEFPEKWGGKWCIGWHDGVRGPFPAKYVEIEGPKQNEISFQATSAVSLKTQWKWDPPDNSNTGWLTFGKGETIKNVGWLYQDHWCWSGTNSKGKFGIFPQSHINHDSLKAGLVSQPTKRPQTSGPMRLFSRRRQSSAASSMSGST